MILKGKPFGALLLSKIRFQNWKITIKNIKVILGTPLVYYRILVLNISKNISKKCCVAMPFFVKDNFTTDVALGMFSIFSDKLVSKTSPDTYF